MKPELKRIKEKTQVMSSGIVKKKTEKRRTDVKGTGEEGKVKYRTVGVGKTKQ